MQREGHHTYDQDNANKSTFLSDVKWNTLVALWIFGEEYRIPALQNATMDVMTDKAYHGGPFPSYLLHHVYKHTDGSDSRLRKFFVDVFAHSTDVEEYMQSAEDQARFPQEFLLWVVLVMFNVRKKQNGSGTLKIDYRTLRDSFYV